MYDIIIVGGGPAGLTASIYALRAKKSVLLIEKFSPGGQVVQTGKIENYPGFKSIEGAELSRLMFEQASDLGLEVVYSDILNYDITGKIKKVKTYEGEFEAKTIILALGAVARQLDVENEKKFVGKGISYCATCDGNFFKDKVVAVVGGGNTSFEDCLYLSDIVKKIYLIHRRDEFRGDAHTLEKLKTLALNGKIEFVLNSVVKELKGEEKLNSILVENKISKEIREIKVDGLFVAIGRQPDTALLKDIITLDKNGYIITDENMRTNVDGVYAIGDVREKRLRQIVTACSDGAIASVDIIDYISKNFWGTNKNRIRSKKILKKYANY